MRKGFTLLELVVVIIILGILGTLGTSQYFRMIERSRGAEARAIMGQIRSMAAGMYMNRYNITGFNNAEAGIGPSAEQVPSKCRNSHYFYYNISSAGSASNLTITAYRCNIGTGASADQKGGKTPDATAAGNLSLTIDLSSTGSDTWTSDPAGIY